MDILMVTPELLPFAKTGGLADVTEALSSALADMGEKVSAVLPCYRGIEDRFETESTGIILNIPILDGDHWIDKKGEILKTVLDSRVDVYLIKMDEYFDRENLYAEGDRDYEDNCARFTFFCSSVIELLKKMKKRPDVINCHDWQAALVPIYLKTVFHQDEELKDLPVVTTIHNLGYQGIFWHWDMKLIGVPWERYNPAELEYYGKLNLLKGAIVYSDLLTTVSKGYAEEIQTPENGYGLDGVVRDRKDDLAGILNGINYDIWDPATDPLLPKNYSMKDMSGKAVCKAQLQKEMGLPQDPHVPLVASISRLVEQKGFDIVAYMMDRILKSGVQYVLLGTGEKKYRDFFTDMARKNPDKMAVVIGHEEGLAHRIEAGADIFLMPSRYEPCGLNQMISMKYGTVPVVRATGGLDDTVIPWDETTDEGVGFKFKEYSGEALYSAIELALSAYRDATGWKKLVENCMKEDHSWTASAKEYLAVYEQALAKRKK